MRSRLREGGILAACLGIAVILTWPLVLVFTTRICGDVGDPYQTLWGMRWIRDAVVSLRNPFFTDRVFHPNGATLVFQTFDLPSAVAMVPFWGWLPEVAIYNTAVVLAVTITAYGMFRLVREQTGDVHAALAAGTIFAATPYQFAHLQGHLHLLAMGWLPLYLVHATRILQGRGSVREGLLGGLFLVLATFASWYHLLYALVLTPILALHGLIVHRDPLLSRRTIGAVFALGAVWLALVGPLVGAILAARAQDPITGSHEAVRFSADLYAFVFPNAAQRWSNAFGAHFQNWTGNSTENAAYVGYVVLMLATLGAWTNASARPFVVAAVVGAVLALGPRLQVDGHLVGGTLPYGHLERLLPLLSLAGVPVRFAYVTYLGLAVAAGFGLAHLRARAARFGRSMEIAALLVPLALVLVEYRPRPLITSAYPVPAPMRSWADDPEIFSVFDVWDPYRPMWHATIHRKPIVGGYLSRVPERLVDEYQRHPVLRAILFGGDAAWFTRVDPGLDFAWGDTGPGGAILPGRFQVSWDGILLAPVTGTYELWLGADDTASVSLDGQVILTRSGPCPREGECVATVGLALEAGAHRVAVEFRNHTGRAELRLWWRPPGGERAIVPSSALRTADGGPGLMAEYSQSVATRSGLGVEGGRAALRALGLRYVIVNDLQRNACVEQDLQLPLSYAGEDVRIYEVPPPSPPGH